jgi:hypothetical protein
MKFFLAFAKKSNYERSNSITQIDFFISENAKTIFLNLMKVNSEQKRNKFGEELLDELSDLAEIDVVNLTVSSAKQYHKKFKGRVVSKRYGYYRPRSKYIYINNRTAVRGQILAAKTFAETLLHEWMHHYDFCKLKLNSIHSAGFYARLGHLKDKLGYFGN